MAELKENDIVQSARLYIFMKGKLRWITTGKIFEKMIADPEIPISWDWKKRKFLDDEEIKAKRGKDITKWPEEENNGDNGDGHQTDRVYKMLYVCPWYSKQSGFAGLDEIKEVGFNTYHTYSPFQWEQNGYWDTPEGRADCLRQMRGMLQALKDRGMYGCLQMPLGGPRQAKLRQKIRELQNQASMFIGGPKAEGINIQIGQLKVKLRNELMTIRGAAERQYLVDAAKVMKDFDNAIAGTVEEPDMTIPPNPTLEGQKDIYDIIKSIAPNMQVWGCFNGGQWDKTMNVEAYNVIITDSYCWSNVPKPGTPAAETGDGSLPWWTITPWITEHKFPMMHKVLPKDMGIINIQQGFYPRLPNIQEEWDLYHEEFGLNSFAIYPHGSGQGDPHKCAMYDNRPESYSIKNQCRNFMKIVMERG